LSNVNRVKEAAQRLPLAELMLLLVAIFWGTSYGIAKEALLYTTVLVFLSIRFSFTFLLMLPRLIKEFRTGQAKDWRASLPTGVILLCVFMAETYGVLHTSASNAAFLISFCVLLTPLVEWLVFKQRPDNRIFFCVIVFFLGSYLLLGAQSGFYINDGDAFILLAALLRAVMVVATKKWASHKQLTTFALTGMQMGVVAFGALLLTSISDQNIWSVASTLPVPFWLATAYLVLFCTLFAFFAQNYGVKHSSPTKAALLMGTEPAFGGLFAIIWFGESYTLVQSLGAGLIIAASIFAVIRLRKSKRLTNT